MHLQKILRVSKQFCNRTLVFDLSKSSMHTNNAHRRANKRAGLNNLNVSTPSKLPRNQVKHNHSIGRALSVSAAFSEKDKSSGMERVEIMDVPDKSENDKKSYRVIGLSNGLKALLISDPTQESNEQADEHAAATSDDEEEDADDSENESADDEDSDDEARDGKHRQKRGKLAACSLCVDVGSFSDPRDVQGLAHFLGNFCIPFYK